MIEMTTPRLTDSWRGRTPSDGPSTFEMFASSGWPAMAALVHAAAALHPDELLAARLRSIVPSSVVSRGPKWLAEIGDIEITHVRRTSEVLNDGENLMISWRWPNGQAATMVVYVDHNVGTIVKDAFAVPQGGEGMAATYEQIGEQHLTLQDIDPGDARARITQAIQSSERLVPPFETDGWPVSRPMVEWLLRHLPAGGTGYVRPVWSEDDRQRLLDEFIDSEFGIVTGLSRGQVRDLANPLVWFGCDYGPGDPLRWSAVSVEIVLADWYARKVFGLSMAEYRRLPDVLAGFVRFAHQRQRVPVDLTAGTLASVERWRDAFMSDIGRPGRSPEANAARLARIAAGLDPDDFDDVEYTRETADQLELAMIDLVGGREAYDALDDTPLPDADFDWSRVPVKLHNAALETLTNVDRWAIEFFDAEVRTIARVVLAGVVATDPGMLTRSPRHDVLAAAILYFVMKHVTRRFSPSESARVPWRVLNQKQLAEATGIVPSSLSGRATTIDSMIGHSGIDWATILHSVQRRQVIETGQLLADWRRDNL